MAIAVPIVKQRPANVSFSKNQMLYRFYVFNSAEDGCQLDCQILIFKDIDDSEIVYQLQAYPDVNGYVNLYVNDIIDSTLEYFAPDYNGDTIQRALHTSHYQINYRRISTSDPNPDWNTDSLLKVVKGGVEAFKFDYNNYFANNVGKKPWATWQPDKGFASLQDNFFLSFLLVNRMGGARVVVTAEWSDNSTDTLTFVFDPEGDVGDSLWHIKAGAEALGINAIAAGRQLWRYSFALQKSDATQIGTPYFFYIDYRSFYKIKLFNYYNSLGGVDHIRLLGDQEDDYSRNYTEGEAFSGNIIVGQPASTQYLQINITRLNTYKSDAGYRHRINDMMTLQEIFASAFIWEIATARNYRIWVTNKSNTLKKKSDKSFGFALEWRYGFMEQVYTPIDQDLGAGSDTNVYAVCPISTPIDVSYLDDTLTTKTVTFNITRPSDGVAIQISYRPFPSGSFRSLDVNVLSAVILKGFTYEWRVQTICAPDFVSAFTVAPENFTI